MGQPHRHPTPEHVWRTYMTTGSMPRELGGPWYMRHALRWVARLLPSSPRCRICYYPFRGIGGALARTLLRVEPSRMNPQLCNVCERTAEAFPGGAEIETSLLFADVRGSTTLAERMSAGEFSRLISRFYDAAVTVLVDHNALVEKLLGDEVTGFFVPGIAGPQHARVAVEAGLAILRATGHGDPNGPWVPVGVGVHTGPTFVGAVRAETGQSDIVVLGDVANVGARLASLAGPGEVLVSEAARAAASLSAEGLQSRALQLKGRTEPVTTWALRVGAPS
jgi:adenylate cyclase